MNKIAITAFVLFLCAGAVPAQSPASSEDQDMLEEVAAFTAAGPNGQRLLLSRVTDFDWDTVRGFHGTTSIAEYRTALGEGFQLDPAIKPQLTDDSAVLVFLKDGAVVRQVVFGPPVFLSGLHGQAWERENAILTVHTKDPGPYSVIRFVQ